MTHGIQDSLDLHRHIQASCHIRVTFHMLGLFSAQDAVSSILHLLRSRSHPSLSHNSRATSSIKPSLIPRSSIPSLTPCQVRFTLFYTLGFHSPFIVHIFLCYLLYPVWTCNCDLLAFSTWIQAPYEQEPPFMCSSFFFSTLKHGACLLWDQCMFLESDLLGAIWNHRSCESPPSNKKEWLVCFLLQRRRNSLTETQPKSI